MENNNLDVSVPENIRNVFVDKASAKQIETNLAGDGSNCSAEKKENQGDKVMEKTEITEVVKAEVETLLSEKDAQAKVTEKISGLESDKASLQAKIDELTVANKSLSDKNTELEGAKSNLEKNISDLTSEKDNAVAECKKAKNELDSIKKEQKTVSRKNELSTAGLLISDEALQTKQVAKISEMNDEQFVDYMSELKAISKCGDGGKKTDTKEEKKDKSKAEEIETAKASVQAKPLTDGELYQQAVAGVQAPSASEDGLAKYAQM